MADLVFVKGYTAGEAAELLKMEPDETNKRLAFIQDRLRAKLLLDEHETFDLSEYTPH